MKKNLITGILLGFVTGIIDIILMIMQNLTIDAILSALFMWIVVGFLLSITKINTKGFIKGIIISFLVLLPNLFIIGWNEPLSLIPVIIMTGILGAIIGILFEKLKK